MGKKKQAVTERDMEFFRGVYQIEADFKGESARLPLFYYDSTAITAIYPAPLGKLRKILPKKDYHPVPVLPGVGAVAITCFEYRDTDIRPYNEISISVLMSYKKSPGLPAAGVVKSLMRNEFHTYIHHLPVTTQVALDGGVDVYNFPKFLAEINFEYTDDAIRCELLEKGEHILTLTGKKLKTGKGKTLHFCTYPVKEDRAQMADVLLRAKEMAMSFNPNAADLELGDHPIGKELKDLLLMKKPITYMYMPDFQAILYGPSVLE